MTKIITMALKDLRLLVRDKFGLFWVLAFPLLMALFFGSIFSGGSSSQSALDVAFVGDNSESSVGFRDKLAAAELVNLTEMPADSAGKAVSTGDQVAYIRYTDSSGGANFFAGNKPSIEVGIDPSRRAESGYLRGLVNQAYFASLQESMMDVQSMRTSLAESKEALNDQTGLDGEQRRWYAEFLDDLDTFMALVGADTVGENAAGAVTEDDPYNPFSEPDINFVDISETENEPRSSWDVTFPQALQWALIGVAAAFAISIVQERTRGTLTRLRLAPVTRAHILGGKGIACFLACLAVCSMLIIIGIFIFGVTVSSWLHLLLALIASAVCFVGVMMFISVLGKTEQAVGGAGWALLLVMSMTGGGMIPLFFMPGWLRTVSDFSPIKWSVLALEGAVWRGFSTLEMIQPVGVLVGIGVVGFTIGVVIMRRTDH